MSKLTGGKDKAAVLLDPLHFTEVSGDVTKKRKKKGSSEFFHRFAYERRVRLTAETLLAEANARAASEGKRAYVHVVGLGLGVWKLLSSQNVRRLNGLPMQSFPASPTYLYNILRCTTAYSNGSWTRSPPAWAG